MAIIRGHVSYYQEILAIDGFLAEPVLLFGFHECCYAPLLTRQRQLKEGIKLRLEQWVKKKKSSRSKKGSIKKNSGRIPDIFQKASLQDILKAHGAVDISTLDLFDERADYVHDMNNPLPLDMNDKFGTVMDIGSIEHVFDTKQCLNNLFCLVKVGGHLLLHAPCNGYFDHGFHTFSPDCLLQALEINGFEIRYVKYSSPDGLELSHPNTLIDALIWIVAKKVQKIDTFQIPQQSKWDSLYKGRISF